MEIIKYSLSKRIQNVREGKVCQPEYPAALIQQWAKMPIKAYFGSCENELQQLYFLLGLAPEDNPSYASVAKMIFDNRDYAFGGLDEEAVCLLAVPVREALNTSKGKTAR